MKQIFKSIFLLIQFSQLNAQEIPNSNFEEWELINGIEEPVYWETNNVNNWISVTRDTGENILEYAVKITGNAPGFEGPNPGTARVNLIFENDYIIYGIKMKYKYKILPDFFGVVIGRGGFSVRPWLDGAIFSQHIQGWSYLGSESNENWTDEEFYFPQPLYTNEFDSIAFSLFAGGINTGLGTQGNSELYIDMVEFISDPITSITRQEIEGNVTISPNPFKDFIKIDSENQLIEEIVLLDVLGRILFRGPQVASLDLSFINQGIYYLQIRLSDGRKYIKLIQKGQ